MDDVTRISVTGDRPYDVLVGRGLLDALPALLDGAARAAVLYAAPLKQHAEQVADVLRAAGLRPLPIEVPDAEARQDRSRSPPAAGTSWARRASPVPTRWSASAGER